MKQGIHPTACIDNNVKLGKGVKIGPYAIIEENVEIGDGCIIGGHSVIQRYVKMGRNNLVHPQVVLGGTPQDISFDDNTETWLVIGDNSVFREGFTAHRATVEKSETIIGSNCYFMNHSHVAHDCRIGSKTIFANNVAIGGFVEVGNNVFLGGAVVVHQFCRIGPYVMIRGTSGVSLDVLPYTLAAGAPVKHYRLNTIGLRRAGIRGDRYKVLSQAFRCLKNREGLEELEETDEIRQLKEWLQVKSKRGLHGFISLKKNESLSDTD